MKKTIGYGLVLSMVPMMGFASLAVDLKKGDMGLLNQIQMQASFIQGHQRETLKALGVSKDFNGVYHQRFQQFYQGARVLGGYAIIHANKAKGLQSSKDSLITGRLYLNLKDDLKAKPSQQVVNAYLKKATLAYHNQRISDIKKERVVYIDKASKAHWAQLIQFTTTPQKGRPTRPSAIVDAFTMKPYVTWDDIKTVRHAAKGQGFGGNERFGEYEFGKTLPLLNIERDDASGKCYLGNADVTVVDLLGDNSWENNPIEFNCANESTNNTYKTGQAGDGYQKKNGAYSPENDALYAGHVIQFMYRDWYNILALKNEDGTPMRLIMRLHFNGDEFENAFWDGKEMTFGDGGPRMYPLVSLGVAAHEVSHGFTQQHSNLVYFHQSGGMNESFSDMAAQAAMYYSEGNNNWKIGDRIMRVEKGYDAMRYMDTPSRDGHSIDSADKYTDALDVHYASGVYNRLFYLMASAEGWNTRKAFDVMVKANTDYWVPEATYVSGACGILNATKDYAKKDSAYDLATVQHALDEVKIDTTTCH